jgi:hypothetical protein
VARSPIEKITRKHVAVLTFISAPANEEMAIDSLDEARGDGKDLKMHDEGPPRRVSAGA